MLRYCDMMVSTSSSSSAVPYRYGLVRQPGSRDGAMAGEQQFLGPLWRDHPGPSPTKPFCA